MMNRLDSITIALAQGLALNAIAFSCVLFSRVCGKPFINKPVMRFGWGCPRGADAGDTRLLR